MTEDKRLAAAIVALDFDTAIIPRGALRTTPTGAIEKSRTFDGLSKTNKFLFVWYTGQISYLKLYFILAGLSDTDALKLQSYVHLRPAVGIPKKPLLERVRAIHSDLFWHIPMIS